MQGLQTTPARSTALEGMAVETDPLGRVTTYTLDSLGLETRVQTPDGGVQTWQRDFAGQPTVFSDELGRVTTYTYQYGTADGELTPHKPQRRNDPVSVQLNVPRGDQKIDPLGRVTTSIYNAQGDLTETIDPLGRVTTEVWSNGLLESRPIRWAVRRSTSTTASGRRPNKSTPWVASRHTPMIQPATRSGSKTRWAG